MILATFSSCFLLFPPAAAPAPATPSVQKNASSKRQSPQTEPLPAADPHGSEGRKSIKICAQKNSLM